jgi:hypothetical protein
MINFLFKVWISLLQFLDLVGADSRPSSTKMMAFGISSTVLFTAVRKSIYRESGEVWNWPMFWILFLCCAMMFGRWGFDRFINTVKGKPLP